jgi:hypothetical protein
VIGGTGAFVLPAGSNEEMVQTILRKLIIEISGLEPAAVRPVAIACEPIACLIGEQIYHKGIRNPP